MITGDEFIRGQFNIVASGTGTGKTEFVRRTLLAKFKDIAPAEILYVTSRSMTRDQQAELDGIERLGHDDIDVIKYWNGEIGELEGIQAAGIWIMNYNQLAYILDFCDPEEGELLQKIRLAVFDECHTLFSDDFIEGMGIIRQWIRERIKDREVLLIGLTATKGILDYNARRFGRRMKTVNDEYIVNYKARHLICTVRDELFDLLLNYGLTGKTIILCPTIRECRQINAYYHNSVMLFSPNNKGFTEDMGILRRFIIENETLPEDTGIFTPEYERGTHPIDALLTTTSMREGINLREESGIRNVICCISDEMHVKQFMGRCRFSVENLIVVYKHHPGDNAKQNSYTADSHRQFANYIDNSNDRTWFDSISDVVDCSFEEIVRYNIDPREDDFCRWMDERWVCNSFVGDADEGLRYITEEDYELIEDAAWQCRLFGRNRKRYTFNAILRYLCEERGYRYEHGRALDDTKRKVSYKLLFKEKT